MTEQQHYDNILLKIKRKYKDDELLGILLKKISSLEIEVGILKSEISEKDYILEQKLKERDKLYYKKCEAHTEEKLHFKRSKEQSQITIKNLQDDLEKIRSERRNAIRTEEKMLLELIKSK